MFFNKIETRFENVKCSHRESYLNIWLNKNIFSLCVCLVCWSFLFVFYFVIVFDYRMETQNELPETKKSNLEGQKTSEGLHFLLRGILQQLEENDNNEVEFLEH